MVCEQAIPKMDVEVENNKNYSLPEIYRWLKSARTQCNGGNGHCFCCGTSRVSKSWRRSAKSDPRKSGAPAGGEQLFAHSADGGSFEKTTTRGISSFNFC